MSTPLEPHIAELTDELLDSAAHAEFTENDVDFVKQVGQVRVIRRLARALNETPSDEINPSTLNSAVQTLGHVVAAVHAMDRFNFTGQNAFQSRNQLITQVEQFYAQWRDQFRQLIRPMVLPAEAVAELREAVQRLDVVE